MGIKVAATGFGFYNNRRRFVGDEFEVQSVDEIGSWMSRLDEQLGSIDAHGDSTTTDDTPDDTAGRLRIIANELAAKAKQAAEDLKPNSNKATRKVVSDLEAAAAEAEAAAAEAEAEFI